MSKVQSIVEWIKTGGKQSRSIRKSSMHNKVIENKIIFDNSVMLYYILLSYWQRLLMMVIDDDDDSDGCTVDTIQYR